MLKLLTNTKIYVASTAIDFRKAINGLIIAVLEKFETPVNDGSVYVFYNSSLDRVKCLFWDKNGFALYQKRLESGKFKFIRRENNNYVITEQQLTWLLAGLDFTLMDKFKELDFSNYF